MQTTKRASMDFILSWKSPYGEHCEKYHLGKVDYWRDIFPGELGVLAEKLSPGESGGQKFEAGVLVPPYSDKNIAEFKSELFRLEQDGQLIAPDEGRAYPKGCAWKPLNTFREDMTPFRVLKVKGDRILADLNHPLSSYPLTVNMVKGQYVKASPQRGGAIRDIAETLTDNGPGFQVCSSEVMKNVYRDYPFTRVNEGNDKDFYLEPRMIHHLDETARHHVRGLYERLLAPGMKVLDFMASWESHLPDSLTDVKVDGLGLNELELQGNRRLSGYTVHDLNSDCRLPFASNSYDAVLCTASIEYLVRPREVIAELNRVIRPGGILVITFSDRWFPGKEIDCWKDLHPFERQGLILQYLLFDGRYENIATESIRGYPRPENDKYINQVAWSDPIYAVWGQVGNMH